MVSLVLCIDRDNDFGEKAQIPSPIIGRQANMDAAVALGLSDPEDSDTNALFEAIKTYDEMITQGGDAEIATICGSTYVGLESDRILSEQLDYIVKTINPSSVIVVSDGTEDEFIMPLIQSRVKVASLKRVIMKQSQGIEELYYFIRKNLGNERMRYSILTPVALIFLTYSITALLGYSEFGIASIVGILGIYILLNAIDFHQRRIDFYHQMTANRISVFTSLISVLFVLVRGIWVYYAELQEIVNSNQQVDLVPVVLTVIDAMLWVVIVAILIAVTGKALDDYLRTKMMPWEYWSFPFSLTAIGFVIMYASWFTRETINSVGQTTIFDFLFHEQIVFLFIGLALVVIGAITNRYIVSKKKHESEQAINKQMSSKITKNGVR